MIQYINSQISQNKYAVSTKSAKTLRKSFTCFYFIIFHATFALRIIKLPSISSLWNYKHVPKNRLTYILPQILSSIKLPVQPGSMGGFVGARHQPDRSLPRIVQHLSLDLTQKELHTRDAWRMGHGSSTPNQAESGLIILIV